MKTPLTERIAKLLHEHGHHEAASQLDRLSPSDATPCYALPIYQKTPMKRKCFTIDGDGEPVGAGDKIRFTFGIPSVCVIAPIVTIDGELWILTPTHNPRRCKLRELREYVGEFYKHNVKVHTSATGGEASTQVEGCRYAEKLNSQRVADCGVTPCVCPAWARCKWGASPL